METPTAAVAEKDSQLPTPNPFLGQKIVARYRDGRLVKGYTYDFADRRPHFHVFPTRDASTNPTRITLDDLKAVFGVREFEGDASYEERKHFVEGQPAPGQGVEVTFTDGEVLVGTSDDYRPDQLGFLLVPADPRCNNLKIYVVASATRRVRTLRDREPARTLEPPVSRRLPLNLPRRLLTWLGPPQSATPGQAGAEPPAPAPNRPRPHWPKPGSSRLVQLLVSANLLTADQARQVMAEHERTNELVFRVVTRLGLLQEEAVLDFLSLKYGMPVIDLRRLEIVDAVVRLVKKEIVAKHHVFPVRRIGNTLTLAIADPTIVPAIDDVRFATGLQVIPVLASDTAIRKAIDKHYVNGAPQLYEILKTEKEVGADALELVDRAPHKVDITELGEDAGEAPVVRFVNLVLADAIRKRASDIHLEPDEDALRVRYRIDGVLHDVMAPPKPMEAAVLSRVKIMANLDIAERRLPQDGRLSVRLAGNKVDLRASSLPTTFGEKLVLRILDTIGVVLDLPKLGFEPADLERFRSAVETPYGMILVSGPTGSGKSTTLYAAVSAINSPAINIVTVEDPVEFNLRRVNQVHVRDDIGLSFATLLRSILRQDPNVILVGEIRDADTAQIATRAALTGHRVFSTLHTNDAPSTVTRLLDIGIAPFLVASSLRLVVGQRLCRRICLDCREPVEVPPSVLLDVGFSPEEAETLKTSRGAGCRACADTGYHGRTAIYEILEVTPELQDAIGRQRSTRELREIAVKQGMRTLRQTGLRKVAQGITSLEEIVRLTVA